MTEPLYLRRRMIKNSLFKVLIISLTVALFLPLFWILAYIVSRGISAWNVDFFLGLPKPVGESGGGIANAIVGTLMLIGISSALAVPFGVGVGIFLAEFPENRLRYWARLCVETLQGIPSIVTGIIAYVTIVVPLGFSAFSGGVALAIMMLPMVTKATEETLRMIPDSLREAAYAMGVPYYRTFFKVILPTAWSGIGSGILLGIARVSGETAPLLFTAFGNPFMNVNMMKAVDSLPLIIFNYATSPYQTWQEIAWGASLVLVIFVLGLSLVAKLIVRPYER